MRAGSGFRYVDAHGASAPEADRERIHDLVIPPAWEDVWISAEPYGHIQAVGVDEAGQAPVPVPPAVARPARPRQVRACPRPRRGAAPRARPGDDGAARATDSGASACSPTSFRLLDEAAPRIGSARYLEKHGSRGLTTLQRRDAVVDDSVVTLSFPGKSGKRALIEIDDGELAVVHGRAGRGRPRSALLSYERGRRRVPLTPADVNAHVRTLTGGAFTAKDFRTLRGTIFAAEALARIGTVDTAKDRKRAERLAVARDRRGARQHAGGRARQLHRPAGLEDVRSAASCSTSAISPESAIRRLTSGAAARRERLPAAPRGR